MDKENEILKRQLTTLKDEMEDATEKMNEMTQELNSTQVKVTEYKGVYPNNINFVYYIYSMLFIKKYTITDKIQKLEQENEALVIQIEEITAQQIDRDKMLDEFGVAIDTRISEWKVLQKFNKIFTLKIKGIFIHINLHYLYYKGILDEKDMEIARLKENVSQSLMHSVTSVQEENKSQIIRLNDEITRRDAIIVELQTKLSDAIVEINEGAALIEKLKAQEAQE